MDVFQKKSTSKDRLKGSSIQLVKEDQYRKKMKKNYPKLLTSLSDMVKRYEVDFQETFLVRLSDAQQCRGTKKSTLHQSPHCVCSGVVRWMASLFSPNSRAWSKPRRARGCLWCTSSSARNECTTPTSEHPRRHRRRCPHPQARAAGPERSAQAGTEHGSITLLLGRAGSTVKRFCTRSNSLRQNLLAKVKPSGASEQRNNVSSRLCRELMSNTQLLLVKHDLEIN